MSARSSACSVKDVADEPEFNFPAGHMLALKWRLNIDKLGITEGIGIRTTTGCNAVEEYDQLILCAGSGLISMACTFSTIHGKSTEV